MLSIINSACLENTCTSGSSIVTPKPSNIVTNKIHLNFPDFTTAFPILSPACSNPYSIPSKNKNKPTITKTVLHRKRIYSSMSTGVIVNCKMVIIITTGKIPVIISFNVLFTFISTPQKNYR